MKEEVEYTIAVDTTIIVRCPKFYGYDSSRFADEEYEQIRRAVLEALKNGAIDKIGVMDIISSKIIEIEDSED